LGSEIWDFSIFWVFQNYRYFWGYAEISGIFGGSAQISGIFGVFSPTFM
jgi:hypothetical protein